MAFPITLNFLPNVAFFRHLRKIHSWQQLALLVAIIAGVAFTVYDVAYAVCEGCVINVYGYKTWCVNECLNILFLLPCTVHLYYLLRNYDDNMRSNWRDALYEKQTSFCNYTDSVKGMLEIWSRASDGKFQQAQQNFEEKLEDFLGFLQSMQFSFRSSSPCHIAEIDFVIQLRKFIRTWIKVYGEVAIDHLDRPLAVEVHGELQNCSTVVTLVEAAISLLHHCRSALSIQRCMTFLRQDPQALVHLTLSRSPSNFLPSETSMEEGSGQCCSWLGCGHKGASPSPGCYLVCSGSPNEKLVRTSCCGGACWMFILDWRHARMTLATLVGIVVSAIKVALPLMKYEGTFHGPFWAIFDAAPVVVYVLCLLVLLPKVEYISMVADMRTEVQQVIDLTQKVQELRGEVETFANQSQELTDVWMHSTLPRLELLSQIYTHFKNTTNEDLLPQMTTANEKLASLEDWCGGVSGHRAAKMKGGRRLSSRINSILRSRSGEGMELVEVASLQTLVNKIDQQFSEDFAGVDHVATSDSARQSDVGAPPRQSQSSLLRAFDNLPSQRSARSFSLKETLRQGNAASLLDNAGP